MNRKLAKVFCVISLSTLVSCGSLGRKSESKQIAVQRLEAVPLGAKKEEIIRALGQPSEIASYAAEGRVVWNYSNPIDNYERISLTIDSDANSLLYKLFFPVESEPELNIDFVLKSKFATSKFQKVGFPQCGKDYVSDEVLYVDAERGVIVRYRQTVAQVLSISWTSKENTEHILKEVKNCRYR